MVQRLPKSSHARKKPPAYPEVIFLTLVLALSKVLAMSVIIQFHLRSSPYLSLCPV